MINTVENEEINTAIRYQLITCAEFLDWRMGTFTFAASTFSRAAIM